MTSLKLSLILLFLSISAYGQQHLCFEGIPIDGSLAEFTNAMKEKGYKHEGIVWGISLFTGDFADYKDCFIGVYTLKDHDVVNRVTVLLPEHTSLDTIIADYQNIKKKLIDQYGCPQETHEWFPNHFADSSTTAIFQAMKREEISWRSSYSTPHGNIVILISPGIIRNTGQVDVQYHDSINSDPKRKSAMDDL